MYLRVLVADEAESSDLDCLRWQRIGGRGSGGLRGRGRRHHRSGVASPPARESSLAMLRGALYRSMLTKVASKTVATSVSVNHPREPVFSGLGRSTRIFESPASSSEFSAGGSAGPGKVMRGPGSGRMMRTAGDARGESGCRWTRSPEEALKPEPAPRERKPISRTTEAGGRRRKGRGLFERLGRGSEGSESRLGCGDTAGRSRIGGLRLGFSGSGSACARDSSVTAESTANTGGSVGDSIAGSTECSFLDQRYRFGPWRFG